MSTANLTLIVPGSNSTFRVERIVTKCFLKRTIQLLLAAMPVELHTDNMCHNVTSE